MDLIIAVSLLNAALMLARSTPALSSLSGDVCYSAPGPAVPWDLSCKGGANSLHVSASVDIETIDKVSVELYRTDGVVKRPNIHFMIPTEFGQVSSSVPGLDVNAEYEVAVRSHRQGCAEDSGNGTWSNLTWYKGVCRTAKDAITNENQEPEMDSLGVATHWLEVFRIAEAGRTLPDFLDNHDSGDIGGDGAIFSIVGQQFRNDTPITRYCIEVLNTTVPNTTTTTFLGAPIESPYADYRSTNPPWQLQQIGMGGLLQYGEYIKGVEYASWCDLLPDRYIGHLARANLIAASCDTNRTSPTFGLCNCSKTSTVASRRYTGMMPIAVPITSVPTEPGIYPGGLPEPIGRWFSHPAAGRCTFGGRLGDRGCTWQRSPLSHSIYWPELQVLGWNSTPYDWSVPNAHQPAEQTRHNVEIFQKAWRMKGLRRCGDERRRVARASNALLV